MFYFLYKYRNIPDVKCDLMKKDYAVRLFLFAFAGVLGGFSQFLLAQGLLNLLFMKRSEINCKFNQSWSVKRKTEKHPLNYNISVWNRYSKS